ncbi:venom serine protease [Anastrepha obliqua]|uniref:venom serine protease n=1 Tax=Anastrepha obliqua TaxID=95512 RepID=UPI002409F05C|nr:venom serine protease [Anastrepha obliqua]
MNEMTHKQTLIYSLLLLLLLNYIQLGFALFEGCDNTYNIVAGTSYVVQSPYYPNGYPSGTSCRYQFIAPHDYFIQMNCTVNMPENGGSCTTEFLYVSTEGDVQLRGSEQFCGQGTFTRNSLFRRLTIAYASYGSTGNFRCSLTVLKQNCECGWSVTAKIANGEKVGANEFPFMAALQDKTTNTNFCGASIISHRYLLTATHCKNYQPEAAKITAVVGFNLLSEVNSSRYAASYPILRFLPYPGYTDEPLTNDITLVQTAGIIEWSRGVGPICLPPSASATFAYNYVDVAGWGTQSFAGPTSDALMKANLMVIENSVCQQSYDVPIYDSQICTNDYSGSGRDACQFDSGGPVILRNSRLFLIGCISYGQPCGLAHGTGVNTRVTSYLSWIRQQTGYTTCVKPLS